MGVRSLFPAIAMAMANMTSMPLFLDQVRRERVSQAKRRRLRRRSYRGKRGR